MNIGDTLVIENIHGEQIGTARIEGMDDVRVFVRVASHIDDYWVNTTHIYFTPLVKPGSLTHKDTCKQVDEKSELWINNTIKPREEIAVRSEEELINFVLGEGFEI